MGREHHEREAPALSTVHLPRAASLEHAPLESVLYKLDGGVGTRRIGAAKRGKAAEHTEQMVGIAARKARGAHAGPGPAPLDLAEREALEDEWLELSDRLGIE